MNRDVAAMARRARSMVTGGRTSSRQDEHGARTKPTTPWWSTSAPPPRIDPSQLTGLDRDVLDECCQTRRTDTSVMLAADLAIRGRIGPFGNHPMVMSSLRLLNELGLVRYIERSLPGGQVYADIRATPDGYATAGYPFAFHVQSQVGRNRFNPPGVVNAGVRHPGDRTNFQTHDHNAEGGPIERMPLAEHLTVYPDHLDLHAEAMREMRKEFPIMPTPMKYDDPMLMARAIELRDVQGLPVRQVAIQLGVPAGSVDMILKRARDTVDAETVAAQLTSEARAAIPTESLKDAVMRLVTANGPYGDVRDIARDLALEGRKTDGHNLTHVLHSLRKQGQLGFVQVKVGKDRGYRDIRAKANGTARTPDARETLDDMTEPELVAAGADPELFDDDTLDDAPEAVQNAPHAPELPKPDVDATPANDDARWPFLRDLLRRVTESADARAKADKLLDTAAMIEDDNDSLARMMMEQAEALMADYTLSPLEDEYVRFAQRAYAVADRGRING